MKKNSPSFCYKLRSFKEMENISTEYSLSLTPQQRLEILQYLRTQFYKIKGMNLPKLNKKVVVLGSCTKYENRERL